MAEGNKRINISSDHLFSPMTGFYPSTFLGPVTGPRNSIWDSVLILNLELRINYLCIHDTIKRDFCDFQIFTLSKYAASVVINTVSVLHFTLKHEQYACSQTSSRYKKLNLSKKTDLTSSAWIKPCMKSISKLKARL